MSETTSHILVLNGGSSSIKFAVYTSDLELCIKGKIDRIGMEHTILSVVDVLTGEEVKESVAKDSTVDALVMLLRERVPNSTVRAIGHRIVHGGQSYYKPTELTPSVIAELETLSSFAPRHLPEELALVKACEVQFRGVPQYACFDTAFHHDLPRVAQLLSIPRKYESAGIRRYGFHGLSCEYLLHELVHTHGVSPDARMLFAHLGSGSSLTAVQRGASVDTTMGFTPNSGIPMGTRSGDLEPGLFEHITIDGEISVEEFAHMVNFDSGLLGVSETSADMEVLLHTQHEDVRASEAVSFFCYQVRKQIGALAAVLGGIDVLAFSGGMGEGSAEIRRRVCEDLAFLGITLDEERNAEGVGMISAHDALVSTFVVPVNEEIVLAQHVRNCLLKIE